MNKQFKQKYKTILESKIVYLQEKRYSSSGWGKFFQFLKRFPRAKDMFGSEENLRQFALLRRQLHQHSPGSMRFLFRTDDPAVISQLNQDYYYYFNGSIKNLIITEDGAHLIPDFNSRPIRYWYLPGPGQQPIQMPDGFNPSIQEVPGHIPWVDDKGNLNPDYKFPVLVPIGVGGGVGTIVYGDEPVSADPLSPSNLPGWHPPELPPIQPPTPPWLSPMDPNQPNFGIPGY